MKTSQQISEEVAPSTLQALCPAGVRLSRVSLEFTEAATEETEQAVERLLEEVGASQLYLVGDYLNYLYQTKGEKVARQRIEQSYTPESQRTAMWMCKRVSIERRLLSPSVGHSQAVASLDPTEQEIWLTKARDEKWSVKQTRAELRKRSAISNGSANQAPVDQSASRASEAFEVFAAWYQGNSPQFTSDQQEEWNQALLPLLTEAIAHLDDEDFERVCGARRELLAA